MTRAREALPPSAPLVESHWLFRERLKSFPKDYIIREWAQLSTRASKAGEGAATHAPATDMDTQVGESKPTYSVIEFTFSDHDTETEFIVLCNGKRLLIHLSADNFSESPSLKNKYLFFL